MSATSFMTAVTTSGSPIMPSIHSRSPPAEKARSPAPVTTTTFTLASSLITFQLAQLPVQARVGGVHYFRAIQRGQQHAIRAAVEVDVN